MIINKAKTFADGVKVHDTHKESLIFITDAHRSRPRYLRMRNCLQ